MDEKITKAIVDTYFSKLSNHLCVDVAIVGGGPSGLVAAHALSLAGKKVALFERKVAPGGGMWAGGMFFNEIVIQKEAVSVLDEFNIAHKEAEPGYFTADSVEATSGLIFGAKKAGAAIFNGIGVEDVVFKNDKVCGVVVCWGTVSHMGLPVDPLVIMADAVLDGTGHPSEVIEVAAKKAGIKLDTPSGGVMGEKPMWAENGEIATVENTKCLYPGLYASGMAANNASGGFRMGPIFGGMLLSGKKVAEIIMGDLNA